MRFFGVRIAFLILVTFIWGLTCYRESFPEVASILPLHKQDASIILLLKHTFPKQQTPATQLYSPLTPHFINFVLRVVVIFTDKRIVVFYSPPSPAYLQTYVVLFGLYPLCQSLKEKTIKFQLKFLNKKL